MTWSSEAKLRNNNAELSLRYSRGRASEAVSQPPFVIASDRRERGNPTRRVVANEVKQSRNSARVCFGFASQPLCSSQ